MPSFGSTKEEIRAMTFVNDSDDSLGHEYALGVAASTVIVVVIGGLISVLVHWILRNT